MVSIILGFESRMISLAIAFVALAFVVAPRFADDARIRMWAFGVAMFILGANSALAVEGKKKA